MRTSGAALPEVSGRAGSVLANNTLKLTVTPLAGASVAPAA